MLKRIALVALLIAVSSAPLFLAACASTGNSPNALTGSKPVYNDKGRVVGYTGSGYQAR